IDIAEKTDGVFAGGEPIRSLAKIAKQGRVHLAEEFANKRRTELRMVIKESRVARAGSGFTNVARFDFAFPLGIQEIPIGFEILLIDELAVVIDRAVGCRADVVEDVLPLGVRVLVLFEIPPGLIRDLGQDQRRLERIERPGGIELLIVGSGAGADHIGQKFFCAPLAQKPLAELIAARGHRGQFDFREFFFEVRQHRLIAADVNRELSFFLRRFESFFPFLLPRRLHLSGADTHWSSEQTGKEQCRQLWILDPSTLLRTGFGFRTAEKRTGKDTRRNSHASHPIENPKSKIIAARARQSIGPHCPRTFSSWPRFPAPSTRAPDSSSRESGIRRADNRTNTSECRRRESRSPWLPSFRLHES